MTLHNMLQRAVTTAVPGTAMRLGPPEKDLGITAPAVVNIHLYQVNPNPDWRNRDLPLRTSDGLLIERPTAALDLDYLISFYGEDEPLKLLPQRLLGAVVSTLHGRGTPTLDDLPKDGQGGDGLASTGLEEQIRLLRFTPISLSRDEMSKLWSVFYQVPYRLSVSYRCSVVLIEPLEPELLVPRPPLPVLRAVQGVAASLAPRLEAVEPAVVEFAPGTPLRLRGRTLDAAGLGVTIDGVEAAVTSAAAQSVTVELPDGLAAGVRLVRASYPASAGLRLESDPVPLFVLPVVEEAGLAAGAAEPTAAVRVNPPIAPGQRVELLLNETLPAAGAIPRGYRIHVPSTREERDRFEIALLEVRQGTYLTRVEVDGAASRLEVEKDPSDPSVERYNGPTITVGAP